MNIQEFSFDGVRLVLKMPYTDQKLLDMAEMRLRNMDCVGTANKQFELDQATEDAPTARIFDVRPTEWATHEVVKQETEWPRVNGNNVRMTSDLRATCVQVTLETVPK